jgi:hypothetical protein
MRSSSIRSGRQLRAPLTRSMARAVLTLSLLLWGPSCVCHLVECESVESLRVTLPLSASELEGGRLVACRNDTCFAATLAVADIDWSDASHPERDVEVEALEHPEGAVSGSATCVLSQADEGLSLIFNWYAEREADVQRGDVLRVTIEAADGSELFSRDAKVTSVDEDYPNGEDCDDTPCRSASLTG